MNYFAKSKALGAGCCAILLLCASNASAQFYTLADGNARAYVDPASSAGMFNWSILMPNGEWQNQLNQQWFWYRVGTAAEKSIDTVGTPIVSQVSPRSLSTTYANNNFSVRIDYLLSGGLVGSGVSDIAESITIHNFTASPLPFTFFQYSDFNLGGTIDNTETIQLGQNFRGFYNEVVQTHPGAPAGLTETVTTPGANRGEVGVYNTTLAKLNDLLPSDLNNNTAAGPGNVTWALQWNLNIPAGSTIIINKDKSLNVPVIPEPTVFALAGLGLAAILLRRRS